MKKLLLTLICLFVLIVGCAPAQEITTPQQSSKISVATTFFPLYELTRMVAQDSADVFSIVPTDSEPHSFRPSPQDIAKLSNADAYVTLGVEFEEFEHELAESTNGNIPLIPAGQGITLIDISEDEHDEHEKEEEHHEEHDEQEKEHHDEEHADEKHEEDEHDEHEKEEDHHDHSGNDPHIWLAPLNAIQMVQNVANGLASADAVNAQAYQANAQSATAELQQLHEDYQQGLANCQKSTVIVAHNAYSYLARDYGFTTVEIHGLSPEAEPTPKQIARLIDEAKEHEVSYIFYEEHVDSRVSKSIAEQVGAQVLPLSPVAATADTEATYVSIMRDNLVNLKLALECA